jgi:hypothetical protein
MPEAVRQGRRSPPASGSFLLIFPNPHNILSGSHGNTHKIYGNTTKKNGSTHKIHRTTTKKHGNASKIHDNATKKHGNTYKMYGKATKKFLHLPRSGAGLLTCA